jgi:hypothetical protein
MKLYSPTGRRNYGRPLKRLLDTWNRNRSTSGPTPWQIHDDDNDGTKTRHGESRCCLRAVAGHEIWHWAAQFKTFTERNCRAYDPCTGEVWTEGGFTLALFQGWGMWSEELLEQVPLNFSFWNKFIILHPCGHPVDNNTF